MRHTTSKATATAATSSSVSNHCGYEALDWCSSNSCDNCDRSNRSGPTSRHTHGEDHHVVSHPPPRPKVYTDKAVITTVNAITSATGSTSAATVDTTGSSTTQSFTPNKKLSFSTKLFAKRRPHSKRHTPNSTMTGTTATATNTAASAIPTGASSTGSSSMALGVRVESSASSTSTASSTQPDEYMTTGNGNAGPHMLLWTKPGTPQIPSKSNHNDKNNNNNNDRLESNKKEERFLGPVDLDTLSEEDLDENDVDECRHHCSNDDDDNGGNAAHLVTTNTSDIFASIAPTNTSCTSSDDHHLALNHFNIHPNHRKSINNNDDDDDNHLAQQSLEATWTPPDEPSSSSLQLVHNNNHAFQPILQTEENFGCFPDCNTFLLSSLMMMATAPSSEQPPPPLSENSHESTFAQPPPTTTTSILQSFPLLTTTSQNSVEMSIDENEIKPHSVSSDIDVVTEIDAIVQGTMEQSIEDGILPKNPSISSHSSTTITPPSPQSHQPSTMTTTTTTAIDPLLLLLQQSSSVIDGPPKRHPNELDAMLLRVLSRNDEADEETTTVASADFHLKPNARTTAAPTEEPTIDDVGGLMGALAAGPVDVDDFIPEDSYWAMDTHEFILDELELSRQLIGYHEGCEPPMINDISLLTDDDDEDDDEVPVVTKKVMKRDVRQDLILHRTNKMTRQRTSATADSNELIRRSQAIQQQQHPQHYVIGGLPQRPATITQKNRIRSDPSVVPSRTTASSQKQSYPTSRFPTPTIISRQKAQRQQVSPPYIRQANHDPTNTTTSLTPSSKQQMQQQQRKFPPTSRDVASISRGSNYHSANQRLLLHPSTPTTSTKTNVSSQVRVQPPPSLSSGSMYQFRNKNMVASSATNTFGTRSNAITTTAVLPINDVQRRRVVDIDLSTNPKRPGSLPAVVVDERGSHWMRGKPHASSPLSKYSTTAAEV